MGGGRHGPGEAVVPLVMTNGPLWNRAILTAVHV